MQFESAIDSSSHPEQCRTMLPRPGTEVREVTAWRTMTADVAGWWRGRQVLPKGIAGNQRQRAQD
jgi:hypothetical protein